MTRPGPIRAAGVVLYDADDRIAVVHRPRRGDWSLPKGKLEPGEPHLLAALRECHEETGQRARLEAPLPSRSYEVDGVPKVVRYWRAQVTSDDGFVPGDEVDDLRWVGADEAAALLTYADDVDLVVRSGALGPSRPLVVLRHAEAVKRAAWRATAAGSDDAARPLTPLGLVQADAVADVLAAYGIGQVVTSPSRRCRQTVEPYADRAELGLELAARPVGGGPRHRPGGDPVRGPLGRVCAGPDGTVHAPAGAPHGPADARRRAPGVRGPAHPARPPARPCRGARRAPRRRGARRRRGAPRRLTNHPYRGRSSFVHLGPPSPSPVLPNFAGVRTDNDYWWSNQSEDLQHGTTRRRRRHSGAGPCRLRLGERLVDRLGRRDDRRPGVRLRRPEGLRLERADQRHRRVGQRLPERLHRRDDRVPAERLRCRHPDFINNQTSFAGSDSALKGDDKTNGRRPLRHRTGDRHPDGRSAPIADRVQRPGRGPAGPHPGGHREHLRQHDHQVERPRDRSGQRRRHPAGRRRSRSSTAATPPARPTTSPSTSTAAAGGAWTFAPRQGLASAPAARAPRARTASPRALKSTANSIGYVEYSFTQSGIPRQRRAGRQRRRRGRADARERRQDDRRGLDHRFRERPDALHRLHDQGPGGLPDRPGHVRDHLREGRCRATDAGADQVVPHLRRLSDDGPGQAHRARLRAALRRRC